MDAAGIPVLRDAIRHGLEATWIESVPVHEKHEGATVWEGEVQVIAVEHPKATPSTPGHTRPRAESVGSRRLGRLPCKRGQKGLSAWQLLAT